MTLFCLVAAPLATPAAAVERQFYFSFGQDEDVPAAANSTGLELPVGDEYIAHFDNHNNADHSDNDYELVLNATDEDALGVSIAGDILYWTVQSFSDISHGGVTGGASDIFRTTNLGAGTTSLLFDGGANAFFPDNVWIDGITVLPDESGVYMSLWANAIVGTNNLSVENNDVFFFDLNTFQATTIFDYSAENPGLTAGVIALHAFSDTELLVSGIFEDEIWLLESTGPGTWSQTLWASGETTLGFPPDSLDIDAIAVATPIPEPSTLALSALGLLSLGMIRKRRRAR